jgi:hypothetical protein
MRLFLFIVAGVVVSILSSPINYTSLGYGDAYLIASIDRDASEHINEYLKYKGLDPNISKEALNATLVLSAFSRPLTPFILSTLGISNKVNAIIYFQLVNLILIIFSMFLCRKLSSNYYNAFLLALVLIGGVLFKWNISNPGYPDSLSALISFIIFYLNVRFIDKNYKIYIFYIFSNTFLILLLLLNHEANVFTLIIINICIYIYLKVNSRKIEKNILNYLILSNFIAILAYAILLISDIDNRLIYLQVGSESKPLYYFSENVPEVLLGVLCSFNFIWLFVLLALNNLSNSIKIAFLFSFIICCSQFALAVDITRLMWLMTLPSLIVCSAYLQGKSFSKPIIFPLCALIIFSPFIIIGSNNIMHLILPSIYKLPKLFMNLIHYFMHL